MHNLMFSKIFVIIFYLLVYQKMLVFFPKYVIVFLFLHHLFLNLKNKFLFILCLLSYVIIQFDVLDIDQKIYLNALNASLLNLMLLRYHQHTHIRKANP